MDSQALKVNDLVLTQWDTNVSQNRQLMENLRETLSLGPYEDVIRLDGAALQGKYNFRQHRSRLLEATIASNGDPLDQRSIEELVSSIQENYRFEIDDNQYI